MSDKITKIKNCGEKIHNNIDYKICEMIIIKW